MTEPLPPGISRRGAVTEQLFLTLTGASKAERAALGDAILDGHHVEVKNASSATLNQVRAVKYIPLAALFLPEMQWFVIPANEIVRQCASKVRGQHTENPFESATLNLRNLQAYAVADPAALGDAVRNAIAEAERYPVLKEAMLQVLRDSRALAAGSVDSVKEALRGYDLT